MILGADQIAPVWLASSERKQKSTCKDPDKLNIVHMAWVLGRITAIFLQDLNNLGTPSPGQARDKAYNRRRESLSLAQWKAVTATSSKIVWLGHQGVEIARSCDASRP